MPLVSVFSLIAIAFLLGPCSPAGAGAPEWRGSGQEADNTGRSLQTSHRPDAQRQLWNGESSCLAADPRWAGCQDESLAAQSEGYKRLGSDIWCGSVGDVLKDFSVTWNAPMRIIESNSWPYRPGFSCFSVANHKWWKTSVSKEGCSGWEKCIPRAVSVEDTGKAGVRLLWIGECGLQHCPAEKLRWS